MNTRETLKLRVVAASKKLHAAQIEWQNSVFALEDHDRINSVPIKTDTPETTSDPAGDSEPGCQNTDING